MSIFILLGKRVNFGVFEEFFGNLGIPPTMSRIGREMEERDGRDGKERGL